MPRILNAEALTSHGNVAGRQAMVQILEAGLSAGDPYANTRKLLRLEGDILTVGGAGYGASDFVPAGSPVVADEVIDLTRVRRIFVFGAGKGVQYAAKAFEDVLGERLSGGHVIAKHGDDPLCERIGVTYGAHPVPDEGCVLGCQRIFEMTHDLTADDLVFTIVGNGVSALLTWPVEGVSLEDVRETTYEMQITRGVPTGDLNPIRNHLDRMKGGKITRAMWPARAIHLIMIEPGNHDQLMHRNLWLHTLPDCTTYADAIAMAHKWHAWEALPATVRDFLTRGDPAQETVKATEFEREPYRIFGVMPHHTAALPTARHKAEELGFKTLLLATPLQAEASQAGYTFADMAITAARRGEPFAAPVALFTSGELLVTVGQETGMGGRNQEYALAAALHIAGNAQVVFGAVDTDGTDGPGTQFAESCGDLPCLAGGITDGDTLAEAKALGIDLHQALIHHDTTPALWQLKSGVQATHNISIGDLGVILILDK